MLAGFGQFRLFWYRGYPPYCNLALFREIMYLIAFELVSLLAYVYSNLNQQVFNMNKI